MRTELNELSFGNIRRLIKQHAKFCGYCGVEFKSFSEKTCDHIIARSKAKGGGNEIENIIIVCSQCNHSKANKPLYQWLQPNNYIYLYNYIQEMKKLIINNKNYGIALSKSIKIILHIPHKSPYLNHARHTPPTLPFQPSKIKQGRECKRYG